MALTRFLLRPLSWIWATVTARRIARGRPVDLDLPVISVGNLTLGGTGKTPVVRALLARLRARGLQAAGLARGYGGTETGPLLVIPESYSAGEVGDEPLMLAADGPMFIARDRAAGAELAKRCGAQVVVMDDGHQNPSLKKSLALVVVDGETRDGEWPFGDGAVFPAGPMREPLAAGLARADAVVIVLPEGLEAADPELVALFAPLPVLTVRICPVAAPPAGPLLGFAGVAKPWKVERALKAAGAEVVDFAPYPDHARLSPGDLAFLRDRAAALGASLVTTEKDFARLSPADRMGIATFPVTAVFEDEAALDALLDKALRRWGRP
jgi:tetraacyldisaccharide 4'-kinase